MKYQTVLYRVTQFMMTEVEAENEEQARQKAAEIAEAKPDYKETDLIIISVQQMPEDQTNEVRDNT